VPGIFQTPEYARAVIAGTGPWLDAAETERRVTARSARQQALFGAAQIPRIHVVLDESALRRQVGGPEVTRRQMSALAEAVQRPEVTIQVLPFTAGACAGMDGGGKRPVRPGLDPPGRPGPKPGRIRRHARRPRGGHTLTSPDTADDPGITWRKSSRSNAGNNCVEIARTPAGIAIRDERADRLGCGNRTASKLRPGASCRGISDHERSGLTPERNTASVDLVRGLVPPPPSTDRVHFAALRP
jgi:hypothetical protein